MDTIYVVVGTDDYGAKWNTQAFADANKAQAFADRLNAETEAWGKAYHEWMDKLDVAHPMPDICSDEAFENIVDAREDWITLNPEPVAPEHCYYDSPSSFTIQTLHFEE